MNQSEQSNNIKDIILLAKSRFEEAGWTVTETIEENGTHLVLEKNGQRKGWGGF